MSNFKHAIEEIKCRINALKNTLDGHESVFRQLETDYLKAKQRFEDSQGNEFVLFLFFLAAFRRNLNFLGGIYDIIQERYAQLKSELRRLEWLDNADLDRQMSESGMCYCMEGETRCAPCQESRKVKCSACDSDS